MSNLTKMTKFEKTRIIGQRAEQLAQGAISTIYINNLIKKDPLSIAEQEFKQKKIPLKIYRTFPNGDIKEYSQKDMIFIE